MAVGLAGWSVCAWAQGDGAHSPTDSYREQLKAEASDQQQANGADSGSREAYKDYLRRLSGDANNSDTRSTTAGKPANAGEPASGSIASSESSSEPRVNDAPAESPRSPVQPISLNKGTRSLSTIVLPPQVSPDSDCSDAYCQQLRRVANGVKPEVRLNTYEPGRTPTTEGNFIRNLAFDQVHIWESPFKLRDSDATWALPFGVVTGSLIATDRDLSKQLVKPAHIDTSKQISNLGLYSFIGAGAGFYGLGLISNDDHKRETGLLAGEAFINATLVGTALKGIVGRERPFESDHFGHIGRGGSSFPSEHALGSWAIASVIAHEYPNPFIQIASYGLASAVSVTRLTAGQHFPSDVFVGATFGYLIGRKMYRDHHNPELSGAQYGTFVASERGSTKSIGSAYVPLDSWVYPVIEKLSGMGYVQSAFLDMRPWSRIECGRIIQEADQSGAGDDPIAGALLDSLKQEFKTELDGRETRYAQIESVYNRITDIAGNPLNDGFHFGQTIINNYGRPYQAGVNSETGFSALATSGAMSMYFRGEYQTAPSAAGYPLNVRQAIASIDAFPGNAPLPVLPTGVLDATNRFRVLEAYASLSVGGYQFSFGKQSLWWGPGEGSAMLFSNNAEPVPMARFANLSPIQLPGIGGLLGPIRFEAFIGRLDGQRFVGMGQGSQTIVSGPNLGKLADQPFVDGQKLTIKPTPNLEFSVSRSAIIGGTGLPLTFSSFGRSFLNLGSGSEDRVGDRRSGVDISYKIPKLRDRLLFYADAFIDDDVSPLNYPRRAPMSAGIYVPKLPGLDHMDLRVEGGYTDIPDQDLRGFFYSNRHYLSGYTNDGNLLGSWIGRDGRGIQAWSSYWFSPRSKLQVNYRYQGVNDAFLQGGGLLNDLGIQAVENLGKSIDFSQSVQFERWNYPVLAATPQNNLATTIQITYRPSYWGWKP